MPHALKYQHRIPLGQDQGGWAGKDGNKTVFFRQWSREILDVPEVFKFEIISIAVHHQQFAGDAEKNQDYF